MTPRFVRLFTFLSALAAAASLCAQTPPPAAEQPMPDQNELITLRFFDSPIDGVLQQLEIHTGKYIIRPNALPTTTYSININRKIPRSEVVLAIETLLELNQVGVVPMGDKALKVVQLTLARTEAPVMIEGSALDLPPSNRIATKVFQLEFLRATPDFQVMVQPYLSQNIGGGAGVVALPNANAAIVTDTMSTLQRIETLLKTLDKPSTSALTPKFYVLRNGAKASDIVTKIRTITQPVQQQLGTATTYNADDRTNQIILLADPRLYVFFDQLIEKLDVKSDPSTRQEVIYLKHANAKEVSPIITNLVNGQNAASQRANAQSVRPGQFNLPATTATPNNPAGTAPTPQIAAPTINSIVPSALDGLAGSTEFSNFVTVAFDDRSNSLIVSGTVDDVRLIKDLVAKLDIVLAQVRIEVIIAEVTLNDTDTSGISALNLTVGTDAPNSAVTGLTGDNGRGTHVTNFAGTLAGWNVSSGVVNPLAFTAALSNNGSRSNVKILQSPTIVTTHNKKAVIKSGTQQPVITSSTTTPNTTAGTTTQDQVTYKDITLSLTVTPLIGDDGSIQMDIAQQVDDVVSTITVNNNSQPIIGTRSATSFVTVQDGQMIVLGGLQRSKNTRKRDKVGLIYEIPFLSQLLGKRDNTIDRTELLLFIRPHVIKPNEALADTQSKIDSMSNKDQVNQYLKDPSKPAPDSLLEKIK